MLNPAQATVHVIKFGGSLGNSYSPSSVTVSVGDTVEWQGNFSFHPLTSTTIPAGAAIWSSSSGTVFDYVVMASGRYDYQCEVHQPAMAGSFTATASGVEDPGPRSIPARFELGQNYPNPFNPTTVVTYRLPVAGAVRFAVFDLLGQEVKVLVNERRNPGVHTVEIDGAGLSSGAYIYRLTVDNNVIGTKKMILMR